MTNNFLNNIETNKYVKKILTFNYPGIFAIFILVINILNNFYIYNKSKKKEKNKLIIKTIKNIIFGVIYISILNYLCSNNMCWVSWILISSQIIYTIITILFIFSIINMLM